MYIPSNSRYPPEILSKNLKKERKKEGKKPIRSKYIYTFAVQTLRIKKRIAGTSACLAKGITRQRLERTCRVTGVTSQRNHPLHEL